MRFSRGSRFEDFVQRPVTIQMALLGALADRGAPVALKPVVDDDDWEALLSPRRRRTTPNGRT